MKRVQLFVPMLDEPRRSGNRGSSWWNPSWLPFAVAGVLIGTGARISVDLSRPTTPGRMAGTVTAIETPQTGIVNETGTPPAHTARE